MSSSSSATLSNLLPITTSMMIGDDSELTQTSGVIPSGDEVNGILIASTAPFSIPPLDGAIDAASSSSSSSSSRPPSTFEALSATLPPYFLEALTIAVMLLTLFGTIGNAMTFVVVMTKELRELSLGVYMAFLAVFDTLTLICGFVW